MLRRNEPVPSRRVLGLPDHLTIHQRRSRLGSAVRPSHRHLHGLTGWDSPAHGQVNRSRLRPDDQMAEAAIRRHDSPKRVAIVDPDRFRIVVTDRIGVNGPLLAWRVLCQSRAKDEGPELALGRDQGIARRPVKSHTTTRKLVFVRVFLLSERPISSLQRPSPHSLAEPL
jgi:hypothetical protein